MKPEQPEQIGYCPDPMLDCAIHNGGNWCICDMRKTIKELEQENERLKAQITSERNQAPSQIPGYPSGIVQSG